MQRNTPELWVSHWDTGPGNATSRCQKTQPGDNKKAH